jgi:DNA-binding HxlR family transcriptional regulator
VFAPEDGTFLERGHKPVTNEVTTMDDGEIASAEAYALRDVLDLVGDKWALAVLDQLSGGPRRFSELERALAGVSRRMLSLTLRRLERNSLVMRTVYPEVPPRVEYEMTPHAGELDAPLCALLAWASKHRTKVIEARRAYDLADASPGDLYGADGLVHRGADRGRRIASRSCAGTVGRVTREVETARLSDPQLG